MTYLFSNTIKAFFRLNTFSQRMSLIALILMTSFACNKNSSEPKGAKIVVEGIVFEDCDGGVAKGQKVILNNMYSGCFGAGINSQESTYTDKNGYFRFEYREHVNNGSTLIGYYQLTMPNSLLSIVNPSGKVHLFPNDTIMNALIHLKFKNKYTAKDTFYCHFKSSPRGYIEGIEQMQFFVGPFKDTTIKLSNLRVGNSNNVDSGKSRSGEFKWGIGKLALNTNYIEPYGSFYLTHKPCAQVDEFEYDVNPN